MKKFLEKHWLAVLVIVGIVGIAATGVVIPYTQYTLQFLQSQNSGVARSLLGVTTTAANNTNQTLVTPTLQGGTGNTFTNNGAVDNYGTHNGGNFNSPTNNYQQSTGGNFSNPTNIGGWHTGGTFGLPTNNYQQATGGNFNSPTNTGGSYSNSTFSGPSSFSGPVTSTSTSNSFVASDSMNAHGALNTFLVRQRLEANYRSNVVTRILFIGDSLSDPGFVITNSVASTMAADLLSLGNIRNGNNSWWIPYQSIPSNYQNCPINPSWALTDWWTEPFFALTTSGGGDVAFNNYSNVNEVTFTWFQQPSGDANLQLKTNGVLWLTLNGYSPTWTAITTNIPLALGNYSFDVIGNSPAGKTNLFYALTAYATNTGAFAIFYTSLQGTSISNVVSTPPAVLSGVYSNLNPDIVIWTAKDANESVSEGTMPGLTSNLLYMQQLVGANFSNALWVFSGSPEEINAPQSGAWQDWVYREMCRTNGWTYVDWWMPLQPYVKYFSNLGAGNNGVHPNAIGSAWGAGRVESQLGMIGSSDPAEQIVNAMLNAGIPANALAPGTASVGEVPKSVNNGSAWSPLENASGLYDGIGVKYPFSDGAGTNVADYGPNAIQGFLTTNAINPVWDKYGYSGYCVDLYSNQFFTAIIASNQAPSFNVITNLTLNFWFNWLIGSIPHNGLLYSYEHTTSTWNDPGSFGAYITPSGTIYWGMNTTSTPGGGTSHTTPGLNSIVTGGFQGNRAQWNMVTMTYDGVSNRLYWDGYLIDQFAETGGITNDSQRELFLGSSANATTLNSSAAFDSFNAWSGRCLTSSNVAQLYQLEKIGVPEAFQTNSLPAGGWTNTSAVVQIVYLTEFSGTATIKDANGNVETTLAGTSSGICTPYRIQVGGSISGAGLAGSYHAW